MRDEKKPIDALHKNVEVYSVEMQNLTEKMKKSIISKEYQTLSVLFSNTLKVND